MAARLRTQGKGKETPSAVTSPDGGSAMKIIISPAPVLLSSSVAACPVRMAGSHSSGFGKSIEHFGTFYLSFEVSLIIK